MVFAGSGDHWDYGNNFFIKILLALWKLYSQELHGTVFLKSRLRENRSNSCFLRWFLRPESARTQPARPKLSTIISQKGPVQLSYNWYFCNQHILSIHAVPLTALGTQCAQLRVVCPYISPFPSNCPPRYLWRRNSHVRHDMRSRSRVSVPGQRRSHQIRSESSQIDQNDLR